MDFDTAVKLAIYRRFADSGRAPAPEDIAADTGSAAASVVASYARLHKKRMLVLEEDGASIRMAPPFSGVATQHIVEAAGIRYYANCAWDALGIPAALKREALVRSRCEQSHESLVLPVGVGGPADSDWLFHCLVPAAQWWDDIVFT